MRCLPQVGGNISQLGIQLNDSENVRFDPALVSK